MITDFTWEQKAHQLADLLRGTLNSLERVQAIAISNQQDATRYYKLSQRLSKKLAKIHKESNLRSNDKSK